MSQAPDGPVGEVSIRTIAMPADTNPAGDIFGGWLMSQMDLAGGTFARYRAHGRVATIAVDGFSFHKPVFVGDELTCYSTEERRGKTSITVRVSAWVRRSDTCEQVKVTEGLFTFVAIDDNRQKRTLPESP
ncbi:MAG: acyl-CoA thioesterase [Rhodospirillaceae bacterium]